jgi:hypothetical protein
MHFAIDVSLLDNAGSFDETVSLDGTRSGSTAQQNGPTRYFEFETPTENLHDDLTSSVEDVSSSDASSDAFSDLDP